MCMHWSGMYRRERVRWRWEWEELGEGACLVALRSSQNYTGAIHSKTFLSKTNLKSGMHGQNPCLCRYSSHTDTGKADI